MLLSLTIELQDHKEKLFHNAPVSPIRKYFGVLILDIKSDLTFESF